MNRAFATRNITPRIAAQIDSDLQTLLSGSHAREIRELLEQRGVIVIRKIDLTDAQQLAFARTLGTVIDQGVEGIMKITLDPKENPMADYLRGTVLWHIDGFGDDIPTLASMLSARRISPIGGQTEFANTYAAFDDLPQKRKAELQQLHVVHTMVATQRDVFPNPTPQQRAAWARFPDKVHPLVWTHRSGRKSLVLGSSASHVVGMDMAQGRALLDELLAWATQTKFVYRHEWSVGDFVMWDNTGCMHRVEAYPADSGRMMHRTTLVGEEAIV
ncbi:MAG: TauD/TfdA dioxygenase family protein [Steroidobacteraceae bacterium]